MNPGTKLKGVFDLRLNWVKELTDRKIITAGKVHTDVNLADQLTKPLPARKLKELDQCMKTHCLLLEGYKMPR